MIRINSPDRKEPDYPLIDKITHLRVTKMLARKWLCLSPCDISKLKLKYLVSPFSTLLGLLQNNVFEHHLHPKAIMLLYWYGTFGTGFFFQHGDGGPEMLSLQIWSMLWKFSHTFRVTTVTPLGTGKCFRILDSNAGTAYKCKEPKIKTKMVFLELANAILLISIM